MFFYNSPIFAKLTIKRRTFLKQDLARKLYPDSISPASALQQLRREINKNEDKLDMKSIIIFLLFFSFCMCVEAEKNKQQNIVLPPIKNKQIKVEKKSVEGLWEQYLNIDIITGDTIPERNCYLKITKFRIQKIKNKIVVYDFELSEKIKNYFYTFNSGIHELIIHHEDSTTLSIMYYNKEGACEFYKKVMR